MKSSLRQDISCEVYLKGESVFGLDQVTKQGFPFHPDLIMPEAKVLSDNTSADIKIKTQWN